MKTFARAVIIFTLLQLLPFPSAAMSEKEAARRLEAMTWYSEEYPPYNFKAKDGTAAGIAVDILMAAFEKIGARITPSDIRIVPWNRSYKYIQRKPGTALFSMTYSPERQKIMKFVGPAAPSNVSIIAPRSAKLKIRGPEDLQGHKIGVVRDDIGDQLLRRFAISDSIIVRKNSVKQLLYLLTTGRIDAVSYAVSVFKYAIKKSGHSPGDYEEVLPLKKGKVGYAFHKSTDPSVLAVLQNAIDELRAARTIDNIILRYSQ